MDMTPEKTPYPKYVIDYNQELLVAEHPPEELLRWNHRLVHLTFIKIKILVLLVIITKRLANMKLPKY